jgi:GNAT superfamily N-acetyltransferase
VAIDSGRVVGLVGLIPHRGYGEVDPIVVTKDYRRRRIARKLLQTVVEEAQRRKWKVLTIKPVARNSVALRTFHAMGFRTLVNIELHMALKGSGWFVPRPGPRLAGKAFLH